ncbi:hypothetical protein EDC04DRAFT_2608628 [Pisolithus marmoratus]|nr:hypothetical protein EDC04DRAFT_2608628 [Pisolithus marmoratus]
MMTLPAACPSSPWHLGPMLLPSQLSCSTYPRWDAVPPSAVHLASALFAWGDFVCLCLLCRSANLYGGWHNMYLVGSGFMSVSAVQKMLMGGPNPNLNLPNLNYIMPLSAIPPEPMMNQFPAAADQGLSALVDISLKSVLLGCPLTLSSVLWRSDLQKPRLRVKSQLTNLQSQRAVEVLPPTSISSLELQLSALVISYAILNPYVTEWDIDRFLEPMRNVVDKTKYFPYPQWGHISDPATVLDVHGREHLNNIHLPLRESLRLEDKVYQSSALRKGVVRQWLQDISYAEKFSNTIADVVLPDLAQVGKDAISTKGDWVVSQPPSPIGWPSIYLGIDVIVNQETPSHLDQVSAPSLLDLVRLFPASISKPKTAFTFDVLDHFLIDALECKTSAMSFYQKLKRFTNNAFPERERYRELMRVSWLWRDLKHRKWFGFGHDMEQDPGDGGLALFCPACPQPGVNMPADWKAHYDRDTIMRQYVIDGNFTAQHMKMNKPELDVALSDRKGYMVAEVPYQSHLKQSLDSREIFRKGRESITKALVIYGVGCQWSINFRSRVKNSPSLLLPPALEIVPVVGKFHLAAHKLSCFPRYSLNFIKGAGHLDGEILETLWAPLNKISPTARSMTQAHRQEVYDDHMRDSNWKKLVGMVPSLLKKYKNSNKCLEEMNQAYEQLTAVLDPDKVARWESDALRVEADREEALDICLLKGDKAPTFQEVWLQLMKNPKSPSGNVGSMAWLAEGISIEDSDAPEEEVEGLASELMSIWMPSSIGAAKLTELGLHDLLKEEREVRIGQANNCLDQLRTDLGKKAMLEGTRTKKEIQKVVARVNKHVRSYQRAQQAILRLDPHGNMAERYQEILPEDLAVSKEVTEENRFVQGSSKLAWFWVIDGEKSQLNVKAGALMEEFYRINWLKARARRDRWKEEVSLEQRALQSTEPGKEAYAKKQMGLWSDFASRARLMFHGKQMDGIQNGSRYIWLVWGYAWFRT